MYTIVKRGIVATCEAYSRRVILDMDALMVRYGAETTVDEVAAAGVSGVRGEAGARHGRPVLNAGGRWCLRLVSCLSEKGLLGAQVL